MRIATHALRTALLAVLSVLLVSPALAQDNIIAFGDFEGFSAGQLSNSGNYFGGDGYFGQTGDGEPSTQFGTFFIDDAVGHDGSSQSLRADYDGGAAQVYSFQFVPQEELEVGTEYTLSVWARTDATSGPNLSGGVQDPNDNYSSVATLVPATALTTEWQEFTVTFEAPVSTTLNFGFSFGYPANEGASVWIDDLSLVANDDGGDDASLVINEVDADQAGTDAAEFVEIYNPGDSAVTLDDYVIVLINGSDDASYGAYDLDGYTVDAGDYFVFCGDAANVPNCDLEVGAGTTNLIQNGQDAVALYTGEASAFPEDTPATQTNLVDAIAYDTNDDDDPDLLAALGLTAQYDENANGNGVNESIQRVPDGSDTIVTAIATPGAANAANPPPQMLTALLRGEFEVPAVDTDAKGGATAVLNGTTLTVTGSFAGLESDYDPSVGSHIHGGAADENGAVVLALTPTLDADNRGGTWEAANNTFTVRSTFADSLQAGLAYVNVHTVDQQGGEIRGQLGTETQMLPFALRGANEVPAVPTTGSGSGMVTIDGDMVTVTGSFMDLESDYNASVGSHIHGGAADENGAVVLALTPTLDADNRGGTWEAANNTFTVRSTFADSLRAGLAYVNVHTVDRPSGEIRGQIGTPPLAPDANYAMNGSFEESETGTVDPNTDTPGWNVTAGGTSAATFEVVEEGAQDGDKALKVTVTATGVNAYDVEAANEPIIVDAGTTYTYSIWAKAETDGATAAFTVGEGPPNYQEFGAIRDASLTTEWQQFTYEFTPDTTSIRAPVHFSFTANVGNAVYIDNLSIQVTPTVLTIAEARAAGSGETVTIEGTVTRSAGAFTYIQDDTAALAIRQTSGDFFDGVADMTIAEGTTLRVTGELSSFNGLLQINGSDLMSYSVTGTDLTPPEAQVVTLSELATNGEAYESELVTVGGVTFADTGNFAERTNYTVTDGTGGDVEFRVPNAGDSTVDDTAIPAQANVTGIVGQFDSDDLPTGGTGYQLLLIEADDIVNTVDTIGGPSAEASLAVANPIRGASTVRFATGVAGPASVAVFDMLGRQVVVLADGETDGSGQSVRLDASGLASGVYVIRMQAGDLTMTRTVTVVR